MTKTLMVLGSMSSAGKSLISTGLCRLYARRGWRVAPFKAQNMSNNAAVCAGGEIGRAQAVQAHAAGLEPTVDMNPVLLKPEADSRSQVILRGRVWRTLPAREFYANRDNLWQVVIESLEKLQATSELVIIEGAGSPVELNLQGHDLVNLAVARHTQAPCLLAGDIDRGGIFAQLLGTLWLLDDNERNLIKALVVNKFRGDLSLFSDGIGMLEDRSGKPVLGVVPFIPQHLIPEEDAAPIVESPPDDNALLDAVVIHLPHISNFDDFDALRAEPGVHVRFVNHPDQLGWPDVVFLPGSKNTLGDLDWLFVNGLADKIKRLAAEGCSVVGFCGGFQMLGSRVVDEHGLESGINHLPGLELLPLDTQLQPEKVVTRSQARLTSAAGFFKALQDTIVQGYEIHLGRSRGADALMQIVSRQGQALSAPDGASSPDGRIWGCHLHGLLENDRFRRAWLESLGVRPSPSSFAELRSQAYDHLADVLQDCLDIDLLDRIIEDGV